MASNTGNSEKDGSRLYYRRQYLQPAAVSSSGIWPNSLRSPSVSCTTMKPRCINSYRLSSATSTMRPITSVYVRGFVFLGFYFRPLLPSGPSQPLSGFKRRHGQQVVGKFLAKGYTLASSSAQVISNTSYRGPSPLVVPLATATTLFSQAYCGAAVSKTRLVRAYRFS